MAMWNYYTVSEQRQIRLEDIEQGLQAVSQDFYIDGDLIVLRGGNPEDTEEDGELICGQITIDDATDCLEDLEFLKEQSADKQNRERLMALLDSAKILVAVQLVNTSLWWDNAPERTLRPLQNWLINNFEGVLWVDGGEFYDRNGLVP